MVIPRACALLALSLFAATTIHTAGAAPGQANAAPADAMAAIEALEVAQRRLVNGDPEPFKALWSHAPDVTLTGGLGGQIEQGWPAVAKRLDWVATQYRNGRRRHAVVTSGASASLAYVVQTEDITFDAPATGAETTQHLRVTMVLRLEDGRWRLVHRHADAQVTRAGR